MAARSNDENLPAILPKPEEYLPSVIEKQVVRTGLNHPGTIYPAAIGVGSALAGAILGMPWLYLVALGGLLGPIWGISQIFLFPDKVGQRYLKKLAKRRERYEQFTRKQVRKGLEQARCTSEANAAAVQGMRQFDKVEKSLESIRDVLDMKLNVRELTFQRFLGSAEQAYLSVLDNLKSVVAVLNSLDSIDVEYISMRVQQLQRYKDKNGISDNDKAEIAALKERYGLWKSQLEEASTLLIKNEEALTAMEKISARVARWRTDKRFAASDIEAAIDDLSHLAEFAQNMTDSLSAKGELSDASDGS